MTMVRWTVLLLAVVFLYDVQCIKVNIDSNFFENSTKQLQNATSIFGDSELSASERNRRLIPYMAFYVPASDLPINEKYLAQRTKGLLSGEIQNSQTAEGHIPVPPTYMHLKAPEPNEADLAYVNNYNQQKLSNHPYHQSIVYHDSNPEKDVNQKLSPVYQFLPPPPAPSPTATSNAMLLPPAYVPHKHKTIQHFPPTTAETRYQQTAPQMHPQQPQQSVIYRPKQSKNNFTPFTESNTLPGHFVPIIYTNKHNTNDDEDFKPGPTQEQTRFKNVPQKLPQKQIDTNDYVLQQQQQQPTAHEQEPHIYLTVTASPAILTGEPAPAEHQTASPIYQLTNQQQQQQQPAKTFHSSLKLQQREQNRHQHRQPATHHTQFQSMKMENLYAQQVDAQFPQYSNGDFVTTPQEKYVVYLQQPVHANRPQQQQQHQQQVQQHNLQASTSVNGNRQPPQTQQQQQREKEIIYSKEQRDHTKQQYVKQHRFSHPIFVSSTPTTPHNHESPEEIHINYGQQQPPVRHATYQPRPELLLTPPQQQSPHILYTPHAKTNSHKQQQQQHLQHIRQQKQQKEPQTPNEEIYFNIPVRNMFENIANHHHHHHHNSHTSALAPTYIEYVIDEPKQSLEEETHQTAHPPTPATSEPTSTTDPRDAYILVTTAAPYRNSQMHRPEHHYGSTVRPLHKERKPTLRLQPIEHSPASLGYYPKYTTMQPKPFKTQQQNQAKYIYVSTKPTYTQLLYAKPTMAIKVKPDYAYVTPNTLEDHTPKQDAQLSKDYPVVLKTNDVAAVEKQTVTNYGAKVEDSAENELPDIRSSSLEEILHKLQASNHLPHTLTPENIDNSIKTLITILNNLKNTQSIVPSPPQPIPSHKYTDDDYTTGSDEILPPTSHHLNSLGPNKHPGPSTGRAGVDFPNYAAIPQTSFDCHTQRYKGFFGDPETNCQVWHYCDLNGGKASFLCPNGTIFSQIALTCDWWFNVKCSTTTQLYVLNERLYKYILPFTPKFPEDYNGPLVDKYLAMKYQEMEEKMRAEKSKAIEQANEVDSIANNNTDDAAVEVTTHHSDEMKQNEPNIQHNLVNDADDTDDISNRGTIDTYEIVTQRQPETVTAADEMPPLSVKPIVVSSTIEPEFDAEMYEQEQNTSSSSVELQQTANLHRPITNITVEKVEVIEIKTDGTTGHLAPDNQTENKK